MTLVPITAADGIALDLRYATADNLTGAPIYSRAVALLRPEAHARLLAASRRAARLGFGLCVYDAFRPLEAQRMLYDALPDKRFVAAPEHATHPRGIAVDLTLTRHGQPVAMGTGFDDMQPQSDHGATDIPDQALHHRALLLGIMVAEGWQAYGPEWWHYNLPDAQDLPPLSAKDAVNGPM